MNMGAVSWFGREYTYASNKDLSRILSPLDLILKKEARND